MDMASPAPSTEEGTQFIPLSDDEETLWTVIEITAERPRHYKVRWEGNDPATERPWAQSWVPKTDCTDDLRAVWKKKKALKKERKGKGMSRITINVSTRLEMLFVPQAKHGYRRLPRSHPPLLLLYVAYRHAQIL